MNEMSFEQLYELKKQLVRLVIKERREQLGLTYNQLAERIKRQSMKAKKLQDYEAGNEFFIPADLARLEDALELPPALLLNGISELLKKASDPTTITAIDIIQSLDLQNEDEKNENSEIVVVCVKCHQHLLSIAERYNLKLHIKRLDKASKKCICEGTASWMGENTAILFRLAVKLSKAKKILILGGSQDVEDICESIGFADVDVVWGDSPKHPSRDIINIINKADIVVIVGGQVGHETTVPYTNAINACPADKRPKLIYPKTSNMVTIAEALLWES